MTYEEALKHIKPRLKLYIQCTDDNIALHKAIEALEKQIPKKPSVPEIERYTYKYVCPQCGCPLQETYPVLYCPDCGQVLDWRGV